jgi:hypothetical protein
MGRSKEQTKIYNDKYKLKHKNKLVVYHRKWNKEYKQTPKGKYTKYKKDAKYRNVEFVLTMEEFVAYWQKPCVYCGDVIGTIGLDRVDSSKGYTIDNIVPCCFVCNVMKMDKPENEFKSHIIKIFNNIKGSSQLG